jgi:hypothetical protein
MRIPLHLQNDHSREAALKRVEHHVAMAQINPKGFRQPGKNSWPTRIERIGQEAFGEA